MKPQPAELLAELRRRGVTDTSDATLDRALYSSDASLYRVVPQAVARPRHPDELHAILDVAREYSVPVTMRGAGTSIAGNAVGPGLVVDTVRHLGRILEVDPEARTARVEPGVVHASLQRAAAPHGLRFGPDPSTHPRCTIGGMIGNNACGSRALGYGRTSDNVADLRLAWLVDDATDRLAGLVDARLAHVRTHFGRFSRQVSGYALEHLLPERGRRLDRFLVGSEGTLAVVTEATVSLVPEEPRRLTVLGYPSMAEAADAVPTLLAGGNRLVACEGLDARIVDLVRAAGRPVPALPRGAGWLFVEVAGEEPVVAAGELDRRTVDDPREAAALWRIREAGAGLAARSLARPAYPGWEDAAVPPEHLGAWLRDFERLLADHGLTTVPYGHFGDGCVHARIDFPLGDDRGRQRFRDFLLASASALRTYGGSISGEHGDGRARSELLPLMYDAESLALFSQVKRACDPDGLLNPGVLVDPAPVDADLRPARPVGSVRTALRLTHDESLGAAVHRCTGVGACVAPAAVGVMCPSYVATREERDSTRGRARVLQEALDGTLVQGLRDPAVTEALDLCLSCKGCVSDCPTGVDMATYKAEVLHQQYAGRRRPRSHYTLGRLPAWLDRTPGWARRLAGAGPVATVAKAVAGVDRRRTLPRPAPRRLARPASGPQPDVWLWADTFTDHFGPGIAAAAGALLDRAGLSARVIPEPACCALTWITTGQLDRAREIVAGTVSTLAPYVASGIPVVGLEPSCLATLRTDAAELVDPGGAAALASGVMTFAELAERLDLPLPDLAGTRVVAQPHCHHASVLGWEADERLLRRAGATVVRVPGCCGLAGNFGMERGHYEVSVAVAESALLPALRADPDAVVLADGLSCRHQLADLAGVRALHLVELLADRHPALPR
ncbi:FAD-binding and (Fe-S)-binding domain-containing protein [Nocardioides coralli]|uniref:FAD-binding and (Fe-S)-binding domain-containing protein n=1 Tax=Nocardioides coralli TaxID=2872154 RepID=UPI001CA3BE6C|nr:FAD-binding and (Fe-S)-binding domain-containing protein [Nocardioides coralli]QZY29557.1 FAD-binding oxidoreductase [Nocardioides coralli]